MPLIGRQRPSGPGSVQHIRAESSKLVLDLDVEEAGRFADVRQLADQLLHSGDVIEVQVREVQDLKVF